MPDSWHKDQPDLWEQHFDAFSSALQKKLIKGAAEYGDASFSMSAAELTDELIEEALDIAGWGFILFTRLMKLKTAAETLRKTLST